MSTQVHSTSKTFSTEDDFEYCAALYENFRNYYWNQLVEYLLHETREFVQYPFEYDPNFWNNEHLSRPGYYLDQATYKKGAISMALVGSLASIMLIIVGLRTWTIRKYGRHYGWLSAKGASDACIILAAVLGTSYFGCMVAYYKQRNHCELMEFYSNTSDFSADVSSHSDGIPLKTPVQIGETHLVTQICISHHRTILEDRLQLASRYILALMIWVVKLGFVSTFFEFHSVLSSAARMVLYSITAFSISSMVAVIGYTIYANVVALRIITVLEGTSIPIFLLPSTMDYRARSDSSSKRYYNNESPSKQVITSQSIVALFFLQFVNTLRSSSKSASGLTPFVFMIPELVLSATDIALELLFIWFVVLLLRTLKLSSSEYRRALFFISPGVLTVLVSIARILYLEGSIINYNNIKNSTLPFYARSKTGEEIISKLRAPNPDNFNMDTILRDSAAIMRDGPKLDQVRSIRGAALAILTPLWAFLGVIVICIPGLRILMRRWRSVDAGRASSEGLGILEKSDPIMLEDVETLPAMRELVSSSIQKETNAS